MFMGNVFGAILCTLSSATLGAEFLRRQHGDRLTVLIDPDRPLPGGLSWSRSCSGLV